MAKPQIFEHHVGEVDINHVAQPAGSELCFAASAAAVLGTTVEEADEGLRAAFVSEPDGSTTPPWEKTEVTIGHTNLVIDPIQSPVEGVYDAEGVIDLIDARLQRDQPVALLFDKNPDSTDMDEAMPHWVLLTGYEENFRVDVAPHWSETTGVHVMNPQEDGMRVEHPLTVTEWIAHSLETTGVYAYALLDTDSAYDEAAWQQVERLNGQGWEISGGSDFETGIIEAVLTLECRANPWSYDEIIETLQERLADKPDVLSACEVVMGDDGFDAEFRYAGIGIDAFSSLVDVLVAFGERPMAEQAA